MLKLEKANHLFKIEVVEGYFIINLSPQTWTGVSYMKDAP